MQNKQNMYQQILGCLYVRHL